MAKKVFRSSPLEATRRCGGHDREVKTCRHPFNHSTGGVNPGLGEPNHGGDAFQQRQQRMISCRRGKYEHQGPA